MIMLNKYFDAIFCINLDRRSDRLERFAEMARKFNFTFHRWPAVDGLELKHPNGNIMEENERRNMELACKLSHLRLLKYAKLEGLRNILIFEDDARLTADSIHKISKVVIPQVYATLLRGVDDESKSYLSMNPEWHMLYLGVNDINKTKEIITDDLARIRTGFTTHSYAVNHIAYDMLINALEFRGQADVLYADYIHPLCKSYAIHPNVAYQEDGFSDITLKEESYQQLK